MSLLKIWVLILIVLNFAYTIDKIVNGDFEEIHSYWFVLIACNIPTLIYIIST